MEIKKIIGNWIKASRKAAALSQTALGAQLMFELESPKEEEYSKARISHWENARHLPTILELAAIRKITKAYLPMELTGVSPSLFERENQLIDAKASDTELEAIAVIKQLSPSDQLTAIALLKALNGATSPRPDTVSNTPPEKAKRDRFA